MLAGVYNLLKKPILYLKHKLSERNFFIFSSILVGITSGFAAILLKYVVHSIEYVVRFSSRNYEDFILFAAFPLVGILLTVIYIRFFLKDPVHRGSSEIVYSIIKKSSKIHPQNIYSHLVSSGLTIGFGGSLGLESPMVSTGSAIGSNYGQAYDLSYKDRTVLIGCGAAAGIAAAFNAPIAGVLFAIEVLLADVSASAFIPLIISAASGALVSKMILKEGVILSFSLQQPFNYHNVPWYVLLGLVSGVIALIYTRVFRQIEKTFSFYKNIWLKWIIGGSILFMLILIFPPLFGEGYETIKSLAALETQPLFQSSIAGNWINTQTDILLFLGALIFFKMIAAGVTISSGGNGGSFAPSLFIGAYAGFVFSRLVNELKLAALPESNFTLVAMAGILSGVFYAPLTAIFLIAELTGGYDLMIPLMIVSSLSLVVSHLFEPLSMEAKKLSEKLKVSIESRDKLLLSRLELSSLIETNFAVVHPNDSLKTLVGIIASSSRNFFPVVDAAKLVGVIHLDKIRHVIFDHSQYDQLKAEQLMKEPDAVVSIDASLHEALEKFDSTNAWNLPVVDKGRYVGFLSKSSILTKYRSELMESS